MFKLLLEFASNDAWLIIYTRLPAKDWVFHQDYSTFRLVSCTSFDRQAVSAGLQAHAFHYSWNKKSICLSLPSAIFHNKLIIHEGDAWGLPVKVLSQIFRSDSISSKLNANNAKLSSIENTRKGTKVSRRVRECGPTLKKKGYELQGINLNFPLILCYFWFRLYFLSQIKLPTSMCFLKFVPQATPLDAHYPEPSCSGPVSTPCLSMSPFSLHQLSNDLQPKTNTTQLAMLSFLRQLALNSQAISALDEKISKSSALLSETTTLVTEIPSKKPSLPSQECLHEGQSTIEEAILSSDSLTTKLFGAHSYKYRLVLAEPIQDTLYKDRNFGLSFKLLNLSTGSLETNGNLINVCLGVCDSNGEWAQETREGTPLLKGKLEAELYHGQGEFLKLSPRDVSRGFAGKKVTLVVYAKPSLLQYSGESSLERRIDHSLIEPLLVKDITIKAKRRD